MILGTVELGLPYGINNTEGKPNQDQAFQVLQTAWDGGITELDTASGYGESEEIIGKFQRIKNLHFLLDTKLPVHLMPEDLFVHFNESCKKLCTDQINILYLHSFEQCKNASIIRCLEELKQSQRINYIGVSIYEPEEMDYIINNLPMIDVIQFPFNVLDNYRWKNNDLLLKAKKSGKVLYSRSVFLQGLVFKDSSDPIVQRFGIKKHLAFIKELCKEERMTIEEFSYKYVASQSEIDNILIGCQSPKEVVHNLHIVSTNNSVSNSVKSKLEAFMKDIPTQSIDPRKWKDL